MKIIIRSFTQPDMEINFDETSDMASLFREIEQATKGLRNGLNIILAMRESQRWHRLRYDTIPHRQVSSYINEILKTECENHSTLYVLIHEPKNVFWLGAQFRVHKSYDERISKANMLGKLPDYFKYFDIYDTKSFHIIDLFLLEKILRRVEAQLKNKTLITNDKDVTRYIQECKKCIREIKNIDYQLGKNDKKIEKSESFDLEDSVEFDASVPVTLMDLSITLQEAKLILLNSLQSLMKHQYEACGYVDLKLIFELIKKRFDTEYAETFYDAETVVKKSIKFSKAPEVVKKVLNSVPSQEVRLLRKKGFFKSDGCESVTIISEKIDNCRLG